MNALRKVWRYLWLYGPGRTLFKVAGRSRRPIPLVTLRRRRRNDIALIGCGQFGVATIGYYLIRRFGGCIGQVYDTDRARAESAARILGVPRIANTPEDIFRDPQVNLVYIASNHASHADYAIAALDAGKQVYIEKPVAVTLEQFARLNQRVEQSPECIHVGYNRPFSGAIRALRKAFPDVPTDPLSLSCFVSGHVIGADHWYRIPEEGTRICGNAGHWIDLFVHMLAWRGLPERFRIQVMAADEREPDDNFSLSIATDCGDIFSLMLTARSEPFEGINETINFQQDAIICKIDDFRKMTVWNGPYRRHWRFWPKDVGHRTAIEQPFADAPGRKWEEIQTSTLLMLKITEMVRNGISQVEFSPLDALKNIRMEGAQE